MKNACAWGLSAAAWAVAILGSWGLTNAARSGEPSSTGYYTWPAYSPNIAYDYVDELGELKPPTKVLDDCKNVVETYANGWWCFRYGPKKNPSVTAAAWVPMIKRLNEDFDYITNVMRWPRDQRARNGYYSTVYLFGSGLGTDDAPNTAKGGWMGSTHHEGKDWPMILASYYPIYSFDPACPYPDKAFQMGGMVHEGIHAILASMPGCKHAGWFHEGGNCWLQATMEARRSGNYSGMGWLSAGMAIAPFQPIECYSGWLQDGSFGGPSAEGVNRFDKDKKQICTWCRLLGGTQYGECFPHAMEVILGPKSVAWVWRYTTQSGRVLQDIAEVKGGLGAAQTRRLIQEFRARQALCDFGPWSDSFKKLLVANWNASIGAENPPFWIDCPKWNATCYVQTTKEGNVLKPEERTLPGWSGANQIPLTVNGTTASVTFDPIGENMSCQLVYRDTKGTVRYSTPVASGTCSIPLEDVKNNVVIAVVCNTDYIYKDDNTRKAKYNYTLTLGEGITGQADIYGKWFE